MKTIVLTSLLPLLLAVSAPTVSAAVPLPPIALRFVNPFWTLPQDRGVPWAPGIAGGIPNYPNAVNVKNAPYNAVGDGVTDDYNAIASAVANCPDRGAVYLPAGTYLLSGQIVLQSKSVILRGDGSASTKLIFTDNRGSSDGSIYIHGSSSGSKTPITGGYTKGSTTLTFNDASGLSVGSYVRIEQDNDTTVLEGNIPGGHLNTSPYYQAQFNQIVAKSGNTVTLARPLYYTYATTLSPRLQSISMTKNCGVENMFIEQRGTRDAIIAFYKTANCWVRNVESTNANWFHVSFGSSLGGEVRASYFNHAQTYGQGGYGIDIADQSSDILIEDNIFYYLRHAIIIQNGASGNVVGYNYSHRVFGASYPDTDYLISDIEIHGGHPIMNLIEGNLCAKLVMDNYWGSSRNNTLFRNHVERYSQGENNILLYGLWAVEIESQQLNENVVGNVLCRPGDSGYVWNIGRDDNSSITDPVVDPRVAQTILQHGNFDYVTRTTQWDPRIFNHNLPPSLYLAQKPAFFGSLPWPPFGPGTNNLVPVDGTIPAKVRYISRFGNP